MHPCDDLSHCLSFVGATRFVLHRRMFIRHGTIRYRRCALQWEVDMMKCFRTAIVIDKITRYKGVIHPVNKYSSAGCVVVCSITLSHDYTSHIHCNTQCPPLIVSCNPTAIIHNTSYSTCHAFSFVRRSSTNCDSLVWLQFNNQQWSDITSFELWSSCLII